MYDGACVLRSVGVVEKHGMLASYDDVGMCRA
jgi:hypothetical protein